MGKSIIPFIFENRCLSSVFIEVERSKNISKAFYFQNINIEDLKTSKYKTVVVDTEVFNKILKCETVLNKIFLINDSGLINRDFKTNLEVIKLNVPFRMNDICQRIENNLIQENIYSERLLRYKYFTYDPSTRKLSNRSSSLRFTEKESQIFVYLLQNTNTYISKKSLLHKVWSYGEEIDTHTLETHVYALRKKIETKLKLKDLIMFKEKKGYYLNRSIL